MAITLELVLGEDRAVYESMIRALPPGQGNNLNRGMVVPSHIQATAQTFRVTGVTPNIQYIFEVQGEWKTPPTPRIYFVPTNDTHLLTLALPYGPSTIIVKSAYEEYRFFASTTYYATLFRAEARELTEYAVTPLQQLNSTIESPFAYRLALPLLSGLSELVPTALEAMASLSHRLLVKNLLYRPGSNGAEREILAAFAASNPVFFAMKNLARLDSPMYRSEEHFAGHEAHLWLPNREVERWRAVSLLLNNIPQLYTIKQIAEGEIYFTQGGLQRHHVFDFDSPLANAILEETGFTECFLRLFQLDMTVVSEHFLEFCQASYFLDSFIDAPGLLTPDADPLAITNWQEMSLTGRFEQQYDEDWGIHFWRYDAPVEGVVDGFNRFFRLSGNPKSAQSLKLFVDGLLQYLFVDYRISLGSSLRSGAFKVALTPNAQYIVIQTGDPRTFIGPMFTSLEVDGNTQLQMILTMGQQTLNDFGVVISHPPVILPFHPQSVSINFVAPAIPANQYAGANQYGSELLTVGVNTYTLIFPTALASIDYQLFVQLGVDPLPGGDPSDVSQLGAIVRSHTLTSAIIEFTDVVSNPSTYLHWWVIEEDGITAERGTLLLNDGDLTVPLLFSGGPYLDQVVLIYQLWNITTLTQVSTFLVSHKNIGPGGTIIQFSAPIEGSDYRLDWALFNAESGAILEFFVAPASGQVVEAQYDELYPFWGQGALVPPPDGVRTEFTLPYTPANEKSLYLVIDGRVMTYGNNQQYVVDLDNSLVRFTFPPTPDQTLWVVMPLANPSTGTLESSWDQGILTRLPDTSGSYATALIKNSSLITPGDVVTVNGYEFEARLSAGGIITNINKINIGDSITFVELGVTLTGVPTPANENEFAINVSLEVDGQQLCNAINAHSVLSLHYVALYQGTGVTVVRAKAFGAGTKNQTLTAFGTTIIATNIVGDTTPSSHRFITMIPDSRRISFEAADVDTTGNFITKLAHGLFTNLGIQINSTGVLPAPLSSGVTYYVVNPGANTFQLALTLSGSPIDLTTQGTGYHTVDSVDVNVTTDIFHANTHGLALGEPVKVRKTLPSTTLPSGLVEGDVYYAVTVSPNYFQLSVVPGGTPLDLLALGAGPFTVYSYDGFPSGVTQAADTSALAASLAANPRIGANYVVTSTTGIVTVKALLPGDQFNGSISVAGTSLTYTQLTGGADPQKDRPFLFPDLNYYYDGAVIALDGVSTRAYTGYSGNQVRFTNRPTVLQEPYFVGETFPIDYHPLDSMVANEPCNYPKGVFTQGLFTQLTEQEFEVTYDADLIITTNNLPVQEEPDGPVDGVNDEFTLTLTSCAGQDSMMFFIDGVFQPPSTWSYSVSMGQGVITTSVPPVAPQKLWVWYLPLGDACVDEHVDALTGTIDGANQVFGIPNGPITDKPTLVTFLEGVFQLQGTDYIVDVPNTGIQFLGALAPAVGQSLWSHYNEGLVIPVDQWRQVRVGTADGIQTTFTIPTFLLSELPTSQDSVLLFLDGICQREAVDFTVNLDLLGTPDGTVTFTGGAPEVGRIIDVAYIRIG